METRVKQPWESRLYTFDVAALAVAGTTIASVDSVTATNLARVTGSAALGVGTPTASGTVVTVRLSSGTAGERYRMRCRVVMSNGDQLEVDGLLDVLDV